MLCLPSVKIIHPYIKLIKTEKYIQNYQQNWNQHVLRMPENRLPRKSLQYQR